MKKIVIGILAHVDAGKTTLSENMLFLSGKIRRMGRVDKKNAYLDTEPLEKSRGITIFSKQAIMQFDTMEVTLLDTPGHVDFAAEMERSLQVLDYAILVVSASDGIQGHTKTLWHLLKLYKIPTFIFVNKMDQKTRDKDMMIASLKSALSDACIDFDQGSNEEWSEQVALCDEVLMDTYLDTGIIDTETVQDLVSRRKVFPVYFGSALNQIGTDQLIEGLATYSKASTYPETFAAKIFKISRDAQGNRLTHLKITGGSLKVKDSISYQDLEEKINQIRVYSGEKFQTVPEIKAGAICTVTGLTKTKAGEALGSEATIIAPQLEAVLSYQLLLPEGIDERQMLPLLRELEEEEPALKVVWNEVLKVINLQIMGAVQIEILQSIIKERFYITVEFGEGQIVYKETIDTVVEGVGHFEPLRHYAEVHLLLEPGERGSGVEFANRCSEDILDKNWQRLVLTHLQEKEHIGVLTGNYITDIKITLVSGRGHNKHTEGGDFREATFRALRQGLKEAKSILLEPYYSFRLDLPETYIGRAMTDIDKMHGTCTIESSDGSMATLLGEAPVSTMRNYQQELHAYTKGMGKLFISVKGYDVCHDAESVIAQIGYDSERDISNPTGSVFCTKGSGYLVPWDEVKSHMHVEAYLKARNNKTTTEINNRPLSSEGQAMSLEEIDAIINSTYYSNRGRKSVWKKSKSAKESYYESVTYKGQSKRRSSSEEFLLVDGYNIIFDWPELDQLAKDHLGAARSKLMDILSNYQAIRKCNIMLVFDAYRVEGRGEAVENYHNIQVVYTAEAQTADQYIEKFAHSHQNKYRIIVATSDGLQQIIIRGAGADLLSARELREVILEADEQLSRKYLQQDNSGQSTLEDIISKDEKDKLDQVSKTTLAE